MATTTESSAENEAIVPAEGWSPQLYRLLIEPDFDASVSNGSVAIEVTEDAQVAASSALPLPIVLDITNITILSASGE